MRGPRLGSGPPVISSLVELVLPRSCVGCGLVGLTWCRECLAGEFDPVLHLPDPCPVGLPPLAAAADYAGSVRGAILAAKERDRRELDRPLGLMLAAAVGLLLSSRPRPRGRSDPVWLIPIPGSPSAVRRRGRDHLSDWAGWAVRGLRAADVPARRVPALRRRAGGLDSVGLDAGQRADNLDGAFVAREIPQPEPNALLVIVDDIVTTGATLRAASTRLVAHLELDQESLGAAVVGATQRTGGRDPGNTDRSLAHLGRSY